MALPLPLVAARSSGWVIPSPVCVSGFFAVRSHSPGFCRGIAMQARSDLMECVRFHLWILSFACWGLAGFACFLLVCLVVGSFVGLVVLLRWLSCRCWSCLLLSLSALSVCGWSGGLFFGVCLVVFFAAAACLLRALAVCLGFLLCLCMNFIFTYLPIG